jgi:hypothetical protein
MGVQRGVPWKPVALVLGTIALVSLVLALIPLPPGGRALFFHGAFVDQGPSPALAPGSTATYALRFRNTGLAPWRRDVPEMQVDLAIANDAAAFAEMRDAWLGADRVATTTEEIVLPGAIGTFTFSARAPQVPGTYHLPLRLLAGGSTWLEDERVAVAVVSDFGFHSQLVDQSGHLKLKPGEASTITVRLRNVGARTWLRGVAGQQVALGVAGDDRSLSSIGIGWPTPDRVAIQAEPAVPSGGIATFAFRVRAPTTVGTYALHVRPVIDGLTWMEDDGVMSLVDVVPAAGATVATQPAAFKTALSTSPSIISSATVSPATTGPGSTVRIDATYVSEAAATAMVGIEVYAPGGTTIAYQQWFDADRFSASERKIYTATWAVPTGAALGTYAVHLVAYAPAWKTLYSSNDNAAAISVAGAPVGTPAPTPTGAPPAPTPTSGPPSPTAVTSAPPSVAPTITATAVPSTAPSATPTAAPTPSPAVSFAVSASATPSSVVAGASVAVATSVTSATAATALVDVEVWDTGGTIPAYQIWFANQTFAAGEQRWFPVTWQVPATTGPGSYVVKLSVDSTDWGIQYAVVTGPSITVVRPTPTTSPTPTSTSSSTPTTAPMPSPTLSASATPTAAPTAVPTATPTATPAVTATPTPSFGLSATVSPSSVAAGNAVTISGSITSATAVSGDIVDIYVYAPDATTKLAEQFFIDQVFTAGQQRSYTMSWTTPMGSAPGTYIVKIGVASAGWTQTLAWNGLATTFAMTAPSPTPTPTPTPAGTATPAPTPTPTPAPAPSGAASPLHVQGNRLVNGIGQPVVLHGVNRSGTESACVLNGGWGFSDGAMDQASVNAIKSWRANVVRMPLNEDCWLGINGVNPTWSGAGYQQAIKNYVNLLNQNGVYAILDLHWNAPGTTLATHQQPMADADHAPAFWSQVAAAFNGNNAAIFELYNEPYPDSQQDSVAAWTCWRDGGTCAGVPFQAAGMQTLVSAVRATGATNVIALGGTGYSDYLSRWLSYKPSDPQNDLVAAWHVYNFNYCNNAACWENTGAPVIAQVPVIVTETGTDTCDSAWWNSFLSWLDAHQTSYQAWTWDNWGTACSMLSLVADYTGTPTVYGQLFKAHLGLLP